MAWKRIGGQSYFYRSRRIGNRVVSEYAGRGQIGSLVAMMVEIEGRERRDRKARERAERAEMVVEEQRIHAWFESVELLATAALLAAGLHEHRGQWRGGRVAKAIVKDEATAPARLTWDEFEALVERAKAGDGSTRRVLREILQSGDDPEQSSWLREFKGNPASLLASSLTSMLAGGDIAVSEGARDRMQRMRAELEGPDPTPIERMLVERVVHCWFYLNMMETIALHAKQTSFANADLQERKIASANKRYLASVVTLARVRKLAVPTLRVFAGTAQVNIGKAY